jgi:molybdate transport system substrate-binding protein
MKLFRRCAALALLWLHVLPAQAGELTVSAAASLTEAFKHIGQRFQAEHPGTVLRFNFAASGVLIQQIAQGAPVDVFASADQATMDRGIAQKLVDAATRRDFAANTVVLVVPADAPAGITKLPDLAGPAVRHIAIGKPATVPVGRYTQQALEAAGLWETLGPRFVPADSVRQALDWVARGEAEAGFVYRTDAAAAGGKVRVVLAPGGHAPVTYPAAVVAGSAQPALARAFVDYLLSPAAQQVLALHGFERP